MTDPVRPWGISQRLGAWLNLTALFILGALVAVLANFNAERKFRRWDMTESQVYSVGEETRILLTQRLTRKIYIYIVGTPTTFDKSVPAAMEMLKQMLGEFTRLNPKFIEVHGISLETGVEEAIRLKAIFGDLKPEHVYVLTYKTLQDGAETDPQHKELPFSEFVVGDSTTGKIVQFDGENAIAGAILELINEKPHVVYVTSGHDELSRTTAVGRGPTYQPISQILDQRLNLEFRDLPPGFISIPSDGEAVFIPRPITDMLPSEIDALRTYVEKGGHLFVVGAYDGALVRLLRDFDIDIRGDWVRVDKREQDVQDSSLQPILLTAHPSTGLKAMEREPTAFWWGVSSVVPTATRRHPNVELVPLAQTFFPVVSMDRREAMTAPNIEQLRLPMRKGDRELVAMAARGSYVEKGPEARIVVWGSELSLIQPQYPANVALVHNAFSWLLRQEQMIVAPPKKSENVPLTLETPELHRVLYLVVWGMPALAIAAGIAVWIARRK
jgi:hypothetical protein